MFLKDRLRNQEKNRKSKRSVTMVCDTCGQMFTMSLGEICWHYEAGNIIPCRCESCRTKHKTERATKVNEEIIKKVAEVTKTTEE